MRGKRDTHGPLADRDVELMLRGQHGDPGLSDALSLLRRQGTGPAPAPNAGLAALLADGFAPMPPTARASRRRVTISLLAVGASSGLLLTATGANALPAPGQRAVARVLNAVTPFDFPLPDADHPRTPRPTPGPAKVLTPTTDGPSTEPSRGGADGKEGNDQPGTSQPEAGRSHEPSDSGDAPSGDRGGSPGGSDGSGAPDDSGSAPDTPTESARSRSDGAPASGSDTPEG